MRLCMLWNVLFGVNAAASSGGTEAGDIIGDTATAVTDTVSGMANSVIDDVTSSVTDLLSKMGYYCVEWINGGLQVFKKLTWSAKDLLTFNTSDGSFGTFNYIIDKVSGVLTIIASSLLVLFFLAGLASDAWDSRHDMDIWGLVKDIVKLIISVVVVNNALYFTKLIFNAGAGLAELVASLGVDGNGSDALKLSETASRYLTYGASGIRGLFLLVVYVLGSIVIVVCGVMVTMEIYQRIFKIYVLIPFSTVSYSTFVMGNRSGGEVFSGYLKSICQVALEAMVIMLAICFTYRLCSNSTVMQKLFPSSFSDYAVVSATTYDDYIALNTFVSEYTLDYDENSGSNGFRDYIQQYYDNAQRLKNSNKNWEKILGSSFNLENVNENLLASLDKMKTAPAVILYNTNRESVQQPIQAASFFNNQVKYGEPGETFITYYFYMYPEVSIKDALMLLVQVLFPCMLCVGTVKAASTYTAMAVGKG